MTPEPGPDATAAVDAQVARLTRRLERERVARVEAEAVAERGLRDLYERQREIVLLGAISAEANRATSVEAILRFAVEQLCAHTGWPIGHVLLPAPREEGDEAAEPDATALVTSGIWHCRAPAQFGPFIEASEHRTFARGEGLPGRILASGAPLWITEIAEDARFPRWREAADAGLRAGFGLPVLVGEQVGAVLEFFAEAAVAPDGPLLELAAHVGVQLGRVLERKRAEERLVHDAFHDALTGLPNRALFRERLELAVKRARRHPDYRYAVLFLDLDRFKLVNDSLGHHFGDRLIVEAARRLVRCLRHDTLLPLPPGARSPGEDTLARLGGDEFTILLDDIREDSDAFRVAERLQAALQEPFVLDGHEVVTSASIGVVTNGSADGADSVDALLRNADAAMYRAKANGRARAELFDTTMHAQAMARLRLEAELRRALEREEFRLVYQPIIELSSGGVAGFEALVRWQHPTRGLVSPMEFIPVAEECGLILPLGDWVLRTACAQLRAWQSAFPAAGRMTMSVNIAARQFAQPDLLERVRRVLAETGLAASCLKLEITESAAMGNAARTQEVLQALHALGVRLSIDDFGTGYSSLSYLRRFPLQTLKIDRSFIDGMDREQESREIVRGIIALATTLGMDVVAEGAETAAQVEHLRELSCGFGQGYFFQRPADESTITGLLAAMAPETAGAA